MVAIHRFGFGKGFEALQITKEYLGGKGFGLVQMAKDGLPVPPGMIIPTHNSQAYMQLPGEQKEDWLLDVLGDVWEHLKDLKKHTGWAPLLSVRSGAPVSMPGMMDTILNVGLTTKNLKEWQTRIGEKAALDSYRRLIQMLGGTAFGVPHEKFEEILAGVKKVSGAVDDKDVPVEGLLDCINGYKKLFQAVAQKPFPDTVEEQVFHAIQAVFESWSNPRAIAYRKMNSIPDDMGTAVVIQSMVFGNMGEDSGTGVLFSRNPMTGEPQIMGEFLPNAQGEDVVAGIRTPLPFEGMLDMDCLIDDHRLGWVQIHGQLTSICDQLEKTTYRDMVDLEFTVQQGQLYILQSRVGKRSALAAFAIARDFVQDGSIPLETALGRLTREQFKIVSRPVVPSHYKDPEHMKGIPASPGVASGIVAFTAEKAVEIAAGGIKCILVSKETTPDDIQGMAAAAGILTMTGGATSHAAVVARAMDKPCVVGCADMKMIGVNMFSCGPAVIKEGSLVVIDGGSGRVWVDTMVPVVDASSHSAIKQFLEWTAPEGSIDILTHAVKGSFAIEAARMAASGSASDQLDAIIESVKEGHTVVLDATERKGWYGNYDDQLRECFGEDTNYEIHMGGIFGYLGDKLQGSTHQVIVLSPSPEMEAIIAGHGFMIVGPAKTLHDYLTNPFTTVDNNFVSNVLGHEDMLKMVEDLCKEHGVAKAVVPKIVQRRNALFNKLKA